MSITRSRRPAVKAAFSLTYMDMYPGSTVRGRSITSPRRNDPIRLTGSNRGGRWVPGDQLAMGAAVQYFLRATNITDARTYFADLAQGRLPFSNEEPTQ